MGKFVDLTGQRFGRLTVIKREGKNKSREALWLCKCDCDKFTKTTTYSLKSGGTKSCGCLQKEIASKIGFKSLFREGQMQNKVYQRIRKILNSMRSRCYNIKNNRYKNYGARGIKICEEWSGEQGIKNFYDWSIANGYKNNLSIDRIDNNGDYEPSNCRWATDTEQSNNRTSNRLITYKNETHTLAEWSRILNISYSMLQSRLNRDNWTIEQCFFGKAKTYRRRVLKYDLDGNYLKTYNSIQEAKKECGKFINIIGCCKGKRKTAGGYIWRYVNETND